MKIQFCADVYQYLKSKGYTHLYAVGNRIVEGEPDHEDYILIPLMPGDPRITYDEVDAIVNEINSNEVLEMMQGDEFITFYIDLPAEEIAEFKKI